MIAHRTMKIILVIVTIVCVIGWLSFVPIWSQRVKSGIIKIDTVTKVQIMLGILIMD